MGMGRNRKVRITITSTYEFTATWKQDAADYCRNMRYHEKVLIISLFLLLSWCNAMRIQLFNVYLLYHNTINPAAMHLSRTCECWPCTAADSPPGPPCSCWSPCCPSWRSFICRATVCKTCPTCSKSWTTRPPQASPASPCTWFPASAPCGCWTSPPAGWWTGRRSPSSASCPRCGS